MQKFGRYLLKKLRVFWKHRNVAKSVGKSVRGVTRTLAQWKMWKTYNLTEDKKMSTEQYLC